MNSCDITVPPTGRPTGQQAAPAGERADGPSVLFASYKAGRVVAAHHVGAAFDNAEDVWRLERWLRVPSELGIQHLLMDSNVSVRLANIYYASVHFPATAAFLLWMYLRRPEHYLWARRALVALTASALALHLLVPLAPPRMLPGLGFVDTAALVGPAVYGEPGPGSIADQYAAMPSLHLAWATWGGR